MNQRRSWLYLLLLLGGLSCLMGQGCPPPPPDDPEPPTEPDPSPPVATSCGLIARDCEVVSGAQPSDIVLADLDGDADLDMAVVLFGADSISFWLNDGNGVFERAAIVTVGDSTWAAVAADLDGDGDLDIAATAIPPIVGPGIVVLLNAGDATFADPVGYSMLAFATDIKAADLDGDGDVDLVTSNQFLDQLGILLNDGSGAFDHVASLDVGQMPRKLATGDFDGDGDMDLAVAAQNSDSVSILLNNGDATFADATRIPVGDSPWDVEAGDFDGDGDLDLVAVNAGDFSNNIDTATILVNDGAAGFSVGATLLVGFNPHSVAVGDMDGDGDLDIVTGNNGIDEATSTLGVLLNRGDGSFADAAIWTTGFSPEDVELGDLDGDGDLDAVTANTISNDVSLLANDGSGGFGSGS